MGKDCCSENLIEIRILEAIRKLLSKRVNELLAGFEYPIPLIEFCDYRGISAVIPEIALSSCERSEKERIILLDSYSVTVTFSLPESPESELYCYAYAGAVGRAIYDDPTLGGVVDRAVVTGKKYVKPKHSHCGESWKAEITLRVTVETISDGE